MARHGSRGVNLECFCVESRRAVKDAAEGISGGKMFHISALMNYGTRSFCRGIILCKSSKNVGKVYDFRGSSGSEN